MQISNYTYMPKIFMLPKKGILVLNRLTRKHQIFRELDNDSWEDPYDQLKYNNYPITMIDMNL